MVLHTTKRQNLNASPIDFERNASINDVPFEGWNLYFYVNPPAYRKELTRIHRLRQMRVP